MSGNPASPSAREAGTSSPTASRSYKDTVLDRAGEPVLDLPDARILLARNPKSLIEDFTDKWYVPPRAVCIPITSPDGVNFPKSTCGLPTSSVVRAGTGFNLGASVAQFVKEGCDVYLTIEPTLEFVNVDQLQVVDSKGASSAKLCIGKVGTQELVGITIADALQLAWTAAGSPERIRGVICDLVDLWPMGANNRRLELCCFCASCLTSLGENGAEDVASAFLTHPNPWNLALAENEHGDGISYIDEISSTMTPMQVIGLSKVRGFIDIFGEITAHRQEELATQLIQYLKARHYETVLALRSTRKVVQDSLGDGSPEFKWILLTEGDRYSWNSGLFLDLLDKWSLHFREAPADEVWFNPSSSDVRMGSMAYRSYMWTRSRYVIDSFFQLATSLADPLKRATTGLGRLPEIVAREMLDSRFRRAMGGEMSGLASLVALAERTEGQAGRIGFVGVGLTPTVGKPIVDTVDVAPQYKA